MGKEGRREGRGGEGRGGQGRGISPPPPQNIFGLTPLQAMIENLVNYSALATSQK